MKVQKTFALKSKYNTQQVSQRNQEQRVFNGSKQKKNYIANQIGGDRFSKTQSSNNKRVNQSQTHKDKLNLFQVNQVDKQIQKINDKQLQSTIQCRELNIDILESKNTELQNNLQLQKHKQRKNSDCRCSQKLDSHIKVLKHYLKSSLTVSKQTILYILGIQNASEFKNQFSINQNQTESQLIKQLSQKIKILTNQNERLREQMQQLINLNSQQLKMVKFGSYFQNQMAKFFSSLQIRSSCTHQCLSGFDMRIDKIQAQIGRLKQQPQSANKIAGQLRLKLQNIDRKCFQQDQSGLLSFDSQRHFKNSTDREKSQILSTSIQNGNQTLRRKNKQFPFKKDEIQNTVMSFSFGQDHRDYDDLFSKQNEHCTDSRATIKQKQQLLLEDFYSEDVTLFPAFSNNNTDEKQLLQDQLSFLRRKEVIELQNQAIKSELKQKNNLLNEKIKKILVQQSQISFLQQKIDQIMQIQANMQSKIKFNYNFSYETQKIREILLSCNPTNFQIFQRQFKQIIKQRNFLSEKIMNFKKKKFKQNRENKSQIQQELIFANKTITNLKQKNNELQYENKMLKIKLQQVQGELNAQKHMLKNQQSSLSITLSEQIIDVINRITENGPTGYEGLQWQYVVEKCIFEVAERLRVLSQQMSYH